MYKVMALDVGTKRIGIALSDFLLMIANGHSYIDRNPEAAAIEKIKKIAAENHVGKIVVGVPYNMDGTQGFQAQDCIDFANKIEGYEILFEDERLTSETAEENLKNRHVQYTKEKGLVDMESACVILEQYLSTRKD
ncbi:Holliday junction resolvase RuvX [bacterium]|nr:Holliday junction resolvase RuvX [bacterium]